MKYEIEWQAGGKLLINTDGTDWTPDELQSQVDEAVSDAVDKIIDAVTEEFEDCIIDEIEPAVYEAKPRRLS